MFEVAVGPIRGEEELGFIHRRVSEGGLGGPADRPDLDRLAREGGDDRVRLGVARRGGEGAPCGFVRLDVAGTEAEISLFVEEPLRGRGIGRRLVDWAGNQAGERRLYALIDENNSRARALFRRLDFERREGGPSGWERWVQRRRPRV